MRIKNIKFIVMHGCFFAWLCFGMPSIFAQNQSDEFPLPKEMELRVQFWINVFSYYSIDERIIHDRDKPERIYKIVNLRAHYPQGSIPRDEIQNIVNTERKSVQDKLVRIAASLRSKSIKLDSEEKRLLRLFGRHAQSDEILAASRRVGAQKGAKESFREGLVRSGRYIDYMREIFRQKGLPEQLAYIPHIESSFHSGAYSYAGAAGVWQFMRRTGLEYMHICNIIDERKDPYISTIAAADLLAFNYSRAGSWPLAITAYNHGLSGILRGVRQSGSSDIWDLIQNYTNRRFGYATKNFYAEFLAAVHIAENVNQYFPGLQIDEPKRFKILSLNENVHIDSLLKQQNLDENKFKHFNPALRPSLFNGARIIPPSYSVRIPCEEDVKETEVTRKNVFRRGLNAYSTFVENAVYSVNAWVEQRKQIDSAFDFKDEYEVYPADSAAVVLAEAFYNNPADSMPEILREDDLLVHSDGRTITVYPEETLGHYADWLGISTQQLRGFNGLSYRQSIYVGQRLKLNFNTVSREHFENKRIEYHNNIWRTFFASNKIEHVKKYQVQHGESFWSLAKKYSQIPMWLLLAYNRDVNVHRVQKGQFMRIPLINSSPQVYNSSL